MVSNKLYDRFPGSVWERFKIAVESTFELSPETMDEVEQLISMNVKKAVGDDQIPARLLKDTTLVIAESVTYRVGLKKIFSKTKSSLFFNSFKEDFSRLDFHNVHEIRNLNHYLQFYVMSSSK